MNVLIVTPSGQLRGGAEEALLQYVACYCKDGRSLTVAVLESGPLIQALKDRGAKVVLIQSGQLRQFHLWLRTILRIAALTRREKTDFILGWISKGHLYSGPAALLTRKPVAYFQMGLPDKGFVDRLCRMIPATGGIGCSNFVAQEQSEAVRHPVLAVPLAADLSRFDPVRSITVSEMKVRLGFDPSRPLIGIVGRLQRWKGIHVFAEAFARLKQTQPEIQGAIVGGPWEHELEYETFLHQRIRELGVEDSLRMVGLQQNVPEWMQAMDIIVHASEREPFGIVIVEAMSLGKPVIATIPGGPSEIVQADINGQLVSWGDVDELTIAIEKFLTDEKFALACGLEAAHRARQFSPSNFSSLLDSALEDLVRKS